MDIQSAGDPSRTAGRLFARRSGKALDVRGCSQADGANVIVWPYSGAPCQQW
jgi:hypothetical protein